MSDQVYPELPGLGWDCSKRPEFATRTLKTASGRELRQAVWSSPLVHFSLKYEFLRDKPAASELKTLAGFFMQHRGSFESWLFRDPDDYRVENQLIGIGDGVTRRFQLARSFGQWQEPVCHVARIEAAGSMWSAEESAMWAEEEVAGMWRAGVDYLPSDIESETAGELCFVLPPPVGASVYWTGEYYYRCRFKSDELEFKAMMLRVWSAGKVEFIGSLGDKL